jgi:fumarate reductase flavoprotein subunit
MAGLCAAARARELGLDVAVYEKGDRPGGSMLLSSCVVWRYRSLDDFRAECPGGDPELQRAVIERLDDGLAWLRSLGAPVVWDETGNPRTVGIRFDPRGLTETLVRAAGVEIRFGEAAPEDAEPLLLASGGFQGNPRLVEGAIRPGGELLLRANRWSAGDGLRIGVDRGAATSAGMDEFYGRAMPAPPARIREEDFVPLSQLYGRWARVYTDEGLDITPPSVAWHENDLAQRIGPSAWYVLDDEELEHARERVNGARAAGGTVIKPSELPFETPLGSRVAVHVAAAVTHTIGGVRVDTNARVLDGVYAAGVDAGGVANGGYASGLAQALVLGLAAAEHLAR